MLPTAIFWASARLPTATGFAALLVVVWLVAMAQLLWQFEKQRIAATRQLMHFDPRDLPGPPLAAAVGSAKALYFIDRSCHCSSAALAEIKRLQRTTVTPLAQFVATSQPLASLDAQPLDAAERARWRNRVPATPAVALWDARDRLIYFGPVSAGAFCGGAYFKNYLEAALQSLQQRIDVVVKGWDVVACACPVPANL